MRFGVREIANVVLRAKATQKLGSRTFYKNEPVLYFDTLKTSSLEGAATTVYATGGRGNTRLVSWDGERTLTFTMEDALLSPESFSILSGAGLIDATADAPIYVHTTSQIQVKDQDTIVLPEPACWDGYAKDDEYYNQDAGVYIMAMRDGEVAAEPCIPADIADDHKTITCYSHAGRIEPNDVVLVDYYVKRTGGAQTIEITPDKFGGSYYLEADTLFRRESDGVDMPAEFIIPNCRVQSNFTFSMASTGDPSTFTFTMDAFPDYTRFDPTKKVLCAIQVITDTTENEEDVRERCAPATGVAPHGTKNNDNVTYSYDNDSTADAIKLTISGLDAVKDFKENTFPELVQQNVTALQMDFELPIEKDKTYRIVQHNPVFIDFPQDGFLKKDTDGRQTIRDKVYEASEWEVDPVNTLEVLVSDRPGAISINVFELPKEGSSSKLIKTIDIANRVTFKQDGE